MNTVEKVVDKVSIKRALISVYNKDKLPELVEGLLAHAPGIEFYSTGGTFNFLKGIIGDRAKLIQVSDYTGQPEMQGGLVKTLDYKIYLGLLSEPFNADHDRDLERVHAHYFDLTVVNLYPFVEVVAKPDSSLENARSHIDIGGPTMLRASAKNFLRVTTLCEPAYYQEFIDEIRSQGGSTRLEKRISLSQRVFEKTSKYDEAIANYLLKNASATNCYKKV